MSKRKGKSKKSDPSPDFRLKRRAHGKVTRVRKSAARSRGAESPYSRHKGKLQVAAALALLVLLVLVATRLGGPAPDYDACWAPDAATTTRQSFHFNVFVTVGNATGLGTQFVKVPEKMGSLTGCFYPMTAGYRGLEYVAINVNSQYTQAQHAYTLGDFFAVWG